MDGNIVDGDYKLCCIYIATHPKLNIFQVYTQR